MVKKYANLLELADTFLSIAVKLNISDQNVPSAENDSFTDLEPMGRKTLKPIETTKIVDYSNLVKKNVLEVSGRIRKLIKLLTERKTKLNTIKANALQEVIDDLDLFNKKIVQFALNVNEKSTEDFTDVKNHSSYTAHLLHDNEQLICGFGASQIRPVLNNLIVDITYLTSLLGDKVLSPMNENDDEEDDYEDEEAAQ